MTTTATHPFSANGLRATWVVPSSRVTALAWVIGFALLTAASAQLSVPIPGTPVPVTGQTLVTLLSGAAIGMRLGFASQLLYVAAGALGAPVFADGASGIIKSGVLLPSFGYLVGFLAASALVGYFADRGMTATWVGSTVAFAIGTVVIYAFGASFLAWSLKLPLFSADVWNMGIGPFLVGDIAKAAIAIVLAAPMAKWAQRSID